MLDAKPLFESSFTTALITMDIKDDKANAVLETVSGKYYSLSPQSCGWLRNRTMGADTLPLVFDKGLSLTPLT